MSFNCGTWYDGVTRVPDIEVEEITFYTRKLFGEFDCDFVLGQEFSEYFDVSNTILAIPHVMDFKYEYNTEGSYEHVSFHVLKFNFAFGFIILAVLLQIRVNLVHECVLHSLVRRAAVFQPARVVSRTAREYPHSARWTSPGR